MLYNYLSALQKLLAHYQPSDRKLTREVMNYHLVLFLFLLYSTYKLLSLCKGELYFFIKFCTEYLTVYCKISISLMINLELTVSSNGR